MSALDNDLYIWLELTAKGRFEDLSKTLYLSNRPLPIAISESEVEHLPIIKSVNGFGSELSDYLPRETRGTITLDASKDSYGNSRRFLDLLERYTINDQDLVLKYILIPQGTSITPANAVTWASTKVSSYRYDRRREQIEIRAESVTLDRRIVNYVIGEDISNADPESKGKALPIVFGSDVEVKAYSINNGGYWVYATTLYNEHPVGGVQAYKVRAHTGEYAEQAIPASDSTAVWANTRITSYPTLGPTIEQLFPIEPTESTSADNYILRTCTIEFQGRTGASSSGFWEFRLWSLDRNSGIPIDILDTVKVEKSTYSGSITTNLAYFDVTFTFNKLIVTDIERHAYAISIQDPSGNTVGPRIAIGSPVSTPFTDLYRDTANNANAWVDPAPASGGGSGLAAEFTALKLTDSPLGSWSSDNGLGYTFITPFNASPSPKDLDIIVEVDGLKDDYLGSITGSPSSLITRADHAISLMSQQLTDGIEWELPAVDISTYSTEHAAAYGSGKIELNGRTEGRTTLTGLIRDICRNNFARIGMLSDGLTLFSYGTEQESQGRLTHADVKIIEVEEVPAEQSVINDINLAYGRTLSGNTIEIFTSQGSINNYSLNKRFNVDTNPATVGRSEELYGRREIGESRFNWISDDTSAAKLVNILFSTYARYPITMVTLEGDFLKLKDVELFEVYELTHPDLPAFFGTSYGTRQESHEGELVSKGGEEEFRAKKYRAFIEAKKLVYSESDAPRVELRARLILDDLEAI